MTEHEFLHAALSHHQAGRIAEAARLYRTTLAVAPAMTDPLHLLGMAELRSGRPGAGLMWMRRAIAVSPGHEPTATNLRNAAREAIATAFATAAASAAADEEVLAQLSRCPLDDEARATLGLVHFTIDRLDRARCDHAALGNPAAETPNAALLRHALALQERHEAATRYIGTVVIPAFNVEDYIVRALDSVRSAAAYYRRRTGDAGALVRVAVVDDSSHDGTVGVVRGWADANPDLHVLLVQNTRNMGAPTARNLGARTAVGPYLWFLDADDYYFEEHLFAGVYALTRFPQAACARTGIRFDDYDPEVDDEARARSELTNPLNLCVRREYHELIGGFPEEPPFFPCTADDFCYSRSIRTFLLTAKTDRKTVNYTQRPGNHFDLFVQERRNAAGRPAESPAPAGSGLEARTLELFMLKRLAGLRRTGGRWAQFQDKGVGPNEPACYLPFDLPPEDPPGSRARDGRACPPLGR